MAMRCKACSNCGHFPLLPDSVYCRKCGHKRNQDRPAALFSSQISSDVRCVQDEYDDDPQGDKRIGTATTIAGDFELQLPGACYTSSARLKRLCAVVSTKTRALSWSCEKQGSSIQPVSVMSFVYHVYSDRLGFCSRRFIRTKPVEASFQVLCLKYSEGCQPTARRYDHMHGCFHRVGDTMSFLHKEVRRCPQFLSSSPTI